MLIINDQTSLERALSLPIEPRLKGLITERVRQLTADGFDFAEIAKFIIAQPGDSLAAVEKALGFSPFQNPVDGCVWPDPEFTPGWEWIADHGYAYEAVFILDDSGFGHVLLIENPPLQNRLLRMLCAAYAG
jgi:hypothetical protein